MGIDYDQFLKATPVVVLHALIGHSVNLDNLLPNAADLATFEEYVRRIETREKLESFLPSLEEPSVEDLSKILWFLRNLPPSVKSSIRRADARIRPIGGPQEKLSDPVEISKMVDDIFERRRATGRLLTTVQKEVAKEKDVSLKTVQRRFREEMERRKSIFESDK
jgi:hypothetical protein